MLRAIIFDLDGTLTDSDLDKAKRKVSEELAALLRIPYDEIWKKMEEIHYRFNIEGVYDRNRWWEQFSPELSLQEKQRLTNLYWEWVIATTSVKPYAEDVLSILKRKYELILLTDHDGESFSKRERICSLSIVPYFDLVVIAGDDTETTKPSLEPFLFILKTIRLPPQEVLMVGDKPEVDLEGARAIGMHTLLVEGEYGTGWVHTVKDLRGILAYVESLE